MDRVYSNTRVEYFPFKLRNAASGVAPAHETPPTSSPIEGDPLPWCFHCKTFSHILKECSTHPGFEDPYPTQDPITDDPTLDQFLFSLQREFERDSRSVVCSRCAKLDLPKIFSLPWQPEYANTSYQPTPIFGAAADTRREWALGQMDRVQMLSSCPICKLLILTVLRMDPGSWTNLQLVRVATPFLTKIDIPIKDGEIERLLQSMKLETDGPGISRSLFLTHKSSSSAEVPPLGIRMGIVHRPLRVEGASADASGHQAEAELVGEHPDYNTIRSWIAECDQSHPACKDPEKEEDMHADFRVLDVETRMVVDHAAHASEDYIALSYVWGPTPRKYITKPDTVLGPLPQAIEDAMEVTRSLGKRFLWVDAVCIDQDDSSHKATQIGVMGRIYRAAWTTIVNVSGASAEHPIPRVSDTTRFRQLQFSDGDHQYVSTLPALKAYLRQSPWSSRGWVLQEGLMSRRCIYFTYSQVYFECCVSSRCEVDATLLGEGTHPSQDASLFSTPQFRFDFSAIKKEGAMNAPYNRINIYRKLLEEYKRRHLSFFDDSLDAFKAIIDVLSQHMDTEFIWGLPVVDFRYALGWRLTAPTPRVPSLPSWSWAAWDGELKTAAEDPPQYVDRKLEEDPRPHFQPYFRLWGYPCECDLEDGESHRKPWRNTVDDVEILKIRNLPFEDAVDAAGIVNLDPGHVIVEGLVFTLVLDEPPEISDPRSVYPIATFPVAVGEAKGGLIAATEAHANTIIEKCGSEPSDYLLLRRVEYLDSVIYRLLLLEWKDEVAYRIDVVSLKIMGTDLGKMKEANIKRKKFVLG